ncbi:MAG: hypothetical protein U0414_07430 [Polyangiaceae bacterium]
MAGPEQEVCPRSSDTSLCKKKEPVNKAVLQDTRANAAPMGAAAPSNDPVAERKLLDALEKSALGKAALRLREKYSPVLVFVADGTAGYVEKGDKDEPGRRTNDLRLNRTMHPDDLASYFVHEMHHVDEAKSGRSPAVEAYGNEAADRTKYVTTMVKEEITCCLLQFETLIEIGSVVCVCPWTGATGACTCGQNWSWIARRILPGYKSDRDGLQKGPLLDKYRAAHPNDAAGELAQMRKYLWIWFGRRVVPNWPQTSLTVTDEQIMDTSGTTMVPFGPSASMVYAQHYKLIFDQKAKKAQAK